MTQNLILSGVTAVVAGLGLFATSGTAQAQFPPRFPIQPGIQRMSPGLPGFQGTPVRGPNYGHIDQVALQLQRETEQLHEEVHAHFRRTPQYRHLDQDVREIEQKAAHIHEVAHNRGGLRHLHADVKELDRLVHHVEELINDMGNYRELDRRAYAHLRRSLRQVEDTLHHLHDDLHD